MIAFHEGTWYGHILKGHPEMRDTRRLVEEAIEVPSEIRFSRSDPDCRLYFRLSSRGNLYIMVVVDVTDRFVKTAHWARKISGGRVEWSKTRPWKE